MPAACLPDPLFSALGCPLPPLVPLGPQGKQVLGWGDGFPQAPGQACSVSPGLTDPSISCLGSVAQLLSGAAPGLGGPESYGGPSASSAHTSSPPSGGIRLEVRQGRVCSGVWPLPEAGQAPSCPITEHLASPPSAVGRLPGSPSLLVTTRPEVAPLCHCPLLPSAPSSLRGRLTFPHLRRALF